MAAPTTSGGCWISRMASCRFPSGIRISTSLGCRTAKRNGKRVRPWGIGRTWLGASSTMPRRCCWTVRVGCVKRRAPRTCALPVGWRWFVTVRIVGEAGFDNVWIQPAAGDNGIAIGCAYYGHLAIQKKPRTFVMKQATLGLEYSDGVVQRTGNRLLVNRRIFDGRDQSICRESAKLLSEGNVFGWFQGRSEFGPRALGNRSILADPRRADMKDKLNKRVKFRQAFRPFAPIVLYERATNIFVG